MHTSICSTEKATRDRGAAVHKRARQACRGLQSPACAASPSEQHGIRQACH